MLRYFHCKLIWSLCFLRWSHYFSYLKFLIFLMLNGRLCSAFRLLRKYESKTRKPSFPNKGVNLNHKLTWLFKELVDSRGIDCLSMPEVGVFLILQDILSKSTLKNIFIPFEVQKISTLNFVLRENPHWKLLNHSCENETCFLDRKICNTTNWDKQQQHRFWHSRNQGII